MLLRILAFMLPLLVTACGESPHEVTLKIYTAGLGAEGDVMPQDIIDLWEPIAVQGNQMAPIIKLERIDKNEVIPLKDLDNNFDLIPPDQAVKLDREKEILKSKKINFEFSTNNKTSDIAIAKGRIAKHQDQDVFYLKSTLDKIKSYDKPSEVLEGLKNRISHNNNSIQEYVIVYNLVDQDWLDTNQAELTKLMAAARASKQKSEVAAAAASKALEQSQHSLQLAIEIATEANNDAEKANCAKARTLAANIESLKQSVQSLVSKVSTAAKQAENGKQTANHAVDTAAEASADKSIVDNAAKTAANAATAAENAKQNAELAANEAKANVENAKAEKHQIQTICPPAKEPTTTPTKEPTTTPTKEPTTTPTKEPNNSTPAKKATNSNTNSKQRRSVNREESESPAQTKPEDELEVIKRKTRQGLDAIRRDFIK